MRVGDVDVTRAPQMLGGDGVYRMFRLLESWVAAVVNEQSAIPITGSRDSECAWAWGNFTLPGTL